MPVTTGRLKIRRLPQRFASQDHRVISRLFLPGDESRIRDVIQRVLSLDDDAAAALLADVLRQFESRHRNIRADFLTHFETVTQLISDPREFDETHKLLIGSYFTMEYAIESAALFNPSIVPHPNQENLAAGEVRFLMSLRATGEGHVSSLVFRTGVIDAQGTFCVDSPGQHADRLHAIADRFFIKHPFRLKLQEMGAHDATAAAVLDRLGTRFQFSELTATLDQARAEAAAPETFDQAAANMIWLARSNYVLHVPEDADPSGIVIFPTSDNESHGIEDARLVRFTDDDGQVHYYGTYTAYNGFRALPQLIETRDFRTIQIHTLNGQYVQNKGLTLFPRRIDGRYTMISRPDGQNLYLMRSDNIHFWNEAKKMQSPRFAWEFVQIGTCSPPLETEAGWLLLTHGVGPVRQYCIGASLLDRDDPSKLIAQLSEPLIVPTEAERDGYVPNVVYTCGAMIHNGTLIIPYAMSDSATSFATVPLADLLEHLPAGRG